MTWIGATPLTDIGMTEEKYTLLCELARTSEYWAIVLATVNAVAHLKLSSISSAQRGRLASVMLQLDNVLCVKSWGLDALKFERARKLTPKRSSLTEERQAGDPFSHMRSLIKRRD